MRRWAQQLGFSALQPCAVGAFLYITARFHLNICSDVWLPAVACLALEVLILFWTSEAHVAPECTLISSLY